MRPCGMNLLRKTHAGTANGALCGIARHRMRPLPLVCATTVCVALAEMSLEPLVDRSAFALLKLLRLMSEEPLVLAFRFCTVPLRLNEPGPLLTT